MNSDRPFVPNFLQKFDKKLLITNPTVWSVRTHLVLYFVLLFTIVISLFCAALLQDARADNSVATITSFVIMIAIIGFIIWLKYLLRFNVFKRFGKWHSADGLVTYLLIFFTTLLFTFLPFIPSIVQSTIANVTYTSQELVNDINEINSTANLLEYDKIPKKWTADTFYIFKSTYTVKPNSTDTIWQYNVPINTTDKANNFNISDKDLEEKLLYTDSLIKINDSNYILYKAPQYAYVSSYRFLENDKLKILSNKELYNAVIKNYVKPNREQLLQRMAFFKSKYFLKDNEYDYGSNTDNDYANAIVKTYSLYSIDRGINNVAEAQSWFFRDKIWLINLLFYFTLSLSLLVFIFRHSTTKTFFLSILTAVILSILSALFVVITSKNESAIFITMFVYYVLFTVLALTIFNSTTKSLVQGISLNLIVFFTPILPLLCVGYYVQCIYEYNEFKNNNINTSLYYICAEVVGFVLLLILIEPLFKKLYRKWYALPEA